MSSETLSGGEVSIPVVPDTSKFGSQTESGIRGSIGSRTAGLSSIGKAIGLTIGAAAAAAVVGATVAVIHTGFQEAMDASAGLAQLKAGIASTGNAANVTSGGMENLASSLQGVTGQTDDSIVKAEQLLLTFTNIRNVGADKIFDDATRAASDMAAKFGGDASSQAIVLGKALNDPVKGVTALTRVGVSFTQGQKDSIKAMVDTGNTIGAQKIILGELTKEFGGAGEAAGKSLPGQLAIAQRSFEDFSQGIVETFIPVVLPVLQKVLKVFQDNAPAIQAVARDVAGGLKQAFHDLKKPVEDVGNFMQNIVGPALGTLFDWIGKYPVAFEAGAIAVGVLSAAMFVLDAAAALNPVGAVVLALEGLTAEGILISVNFDKVKALWVAAFTVMGDTVWNMLNGLATGFDTFFNGLAAVLNTILTPLNLIRAMFGQGAIKVPKLDLSALTSAGQGGFDNLMATVGGSQKYGVAAPTKAGLPTYGGGGTVLPTPGGKVVRVAERGRSETIVDTATLQDAVNGRGGSNVTQNIYTSDPMIAANQSANMLKSRLALSR